MPIKGLLFVLFVAALAGIFAACEFGEDSEEEYYEEEFEEETEK